MNSILFEGCSGVDVFTWQKLLNAQGDGKVVEPDGDFGPKTKAATIAYQKKHGLVADGVVGPITWAKGHPNYTATQLKAAANHVVGPIAEKSIEVALSHEGLKEEPGNRGTLVDAWNKAMKVPVGSPWCASFVMQCRSRAATVLGCTDPLKPYYSASCFGLLGKVPDEWRVENKMKGQRGDLVVFGFSHIGIVLKNNGDGTYLTIEGNTNEAGQREGQFVMRKTRKYNQVAAFIRIPEGV